MDIIINFLTNLLELSLSAAPWLVLGLIVGGLIHAVIPMSFLEKHLGGQGIIPIIKAALLGAPLPLCSCGVIPAALGLRKAGASKQSTVSFLVSTPETGVDSVMITYALLGPFMAIVRPIAAIISAITAGLLVGKTEDQNEDHFNSHALDKETSSCCSSEPVKEESSCCSSEPVIEEASCCESEPVVETTSCCSSEPAEEVSSCCSESDSGDAHEIQTPGLLRKIMGGIQYAFADLFTMLLFWLCIGLLFAAAIKTFVPTTFLVEWGGGLPGMLVMMVIGIPMYVCATASTPIAAGFMLAGVSPGTALVFLMAGPATNISTLGVIGKELGRKSLIAYLTGVGAVALIAGLITDYLVGKFGIDIQGQLQHGEHFVPHWLAAVSLGILVLVAIRSFIPKSNQK